MARSYEYECRSCGYKVSQPKRERPTARCGHCGDNRWRRAHDYGDAWLRDKPSRG